jgi:plastocyanin
MLKPKSIVAVWVVAIFVLTTAGSVIAGDEIRITLKDNRFHPAEVKANAGVEITLIVRNDDKMAEEFESRDLKQEKLIRAGGTATLKIRPLKAGTYEFFGEFHPETAKGRLVIE